MSNWRGLDPCHATSSSFTASVRWSRYFFFWGTYPCGEDAIGTRGGNFASQCEKGGGVRYETMASDVARAVRWARDNAARLGESVLKPSLVVLNGSSHAVCVMTLRGRPIETATRGPFIRRALVYTCRDGSEISRRRRHGTQRPPWSGWTVRSI